MRSSPLGTQVGPPGPCRDHSPATEAFAHCDTRAAGRGRALRRRDEGGLVGSVRRGAADRANARETDGRFPRSAGCGGSRSPTFGSGSRRAACRGRPPWSGTRPRAPARTAGAESSDVAVYFGSRDAEVDSGTAARSGRPAARWPAGLSTLEQSLRDQGVHRGLGGPSGRRRPSGGAPNRPRGARPGAATSVQSSQRSSRWVASAESLTTVCPTSTTDSPSRSTRSATGRAAARSRMAHEAPPAGRPRGRPGRPPRGSGSGGRHPATRPARPGAATAAAGRSGATSAAPGTTRPSSVDRVSTTGAARRGRRRARAGRGRPGAPGRPGATSPTLLGAVSSLNRLPGVAPHGQRLGVGHHGAVVEHDRRLVGDVPAARAQGAHQRGLAGAARCHERDRGAAGRVGQAGRVEHEALAGPGVDRRLGDPLGQHLQQVGQVGSRHHPGGLGLLPRQRVGRRGGRRRGPPPAPRPVAGSTPTGRPPGRGPRRPGRRPPAPRPAPRRRRRPCARAGVRSPAAAT